jgi:hypothetical protein
MKTSRILAVVGALLLAAQTASAQGAAVIIKQRAKELRDQNNADQGVTAPAPPAQPASAAAPAGATPAQPPTPKQQRMAKLWFDLLALKPDASITLAMKQRLAKDIIAVADGPAKPSELAANKLAESLSSALSEKLLSDTTRRRLLGDIGAALNPQTTPQSQLADITDDIQTLFHANNVDRKEAPAVANDAKAIAVEIQKAAAK